eukprot:4294932-Pyramimonas_sp.AAC.1
MLSTDASVETKSRLLNRAVEECIRLSVEGSRPIEDAIHATRKHFLNTISNGVHALRNHCQGLGSTFSMATMVACRMFNLSMSDGGRAHVAHSI